MSGDTPDDMQPTRIEITGPYAVTGSMARDIGADVNIVTLYIGAALVVTMTEDTAEQLCDALCDVLAGAAVMARS